MIQINIVPNKYTSLLNEQFHKSKTLTEARKKRLIFKSLRTKKWASISSHAKNSGTEYSLVNIWAVWCGPCKKEMPWFKSILGQLNNIKFFSALGEGYKGYNAIDVVQDISKNKPTFQDFQGPRGTEYLFTDSEGLENYPQTFLFKGGRLIAKVGAFKSPQELTEFLIKHSVITARRKQAQQPQVAQNRTEFSDKDGSIKVVNRPSWAQRSYKDFKDRIIYIDYKRLNQKGIIIFRNDSVEDAASWFVKRTKGKNSVKDALHAKSYEDPGLVGGRGIVHVRRADPLPDAKVIFITF